VRHRYLEHSAAAAIALGPARCREPRHGHRFRLEVSGGFCYPEGAACEVSSEEVLGT
jgi:hypothetical protein